MHIFMWVCVSIYTYICVSLYMYVFVCICTLYSLVCICVFHKHLCLFGHICVYVLLYIYIYYECLLIMLSFLPDILRRLTKKDDVVNIPPH